MGQEEAHLEQAIRHVSEAYHTYHPGSTTAPGLRTELFCASRQSRAADVRVGLKPTDRRAPLCVGFTLDSDEIRERSEPDTCRRAEDVVDWPEGRLGCRAMVCPAKR